MENILILGKTGEEGEEGSEMLDSMDSITNSMGMSLGKLQEIVRDREA